MPVVKLRRPTERPVDAPQKNRLVETSQDSAEFGRWRKRNEWRLQPGLVTVGLEDAKKP
ncbi:hypothetical protein MAP00_001177 [Monascus purpureus]|nr:hypothetical protein MAP00_001177 [Monascus purpureus]